MTERKGAVSALFLIVSGIILFSMVLVMDFGLLWYYRAELERSVDAAALAGASEVYVRRQVDGLGRVYSQTVFLDGEKAKATAQFVLEKNLNKFMLLGMRIKSIDITVQGRQVDVAVTLTVPSNFALISGFQNISINKRAEAEYVVP